MATCFLLLLIAFVNRIYAESTPRHPDGDRIIVVPVDRLHADICQELFNKEQPKVVGYANIGSGAKALRLQYHSLSGALVLKKLSLTASSNNKLKAIFVKPTYAAAFSTLEAKEKLESWTKGTFYSKETHALSELVFVLWPIQLRIFTGTILTIVKEVTLERLGSPGGTETLHGDSWDTKTLIGDPSGTKTLDGNSKENEKGSGTRTIKGLYHTVVYAAPLPKGTKNPAANVYWYLDVGADVSWFNG